MSYDYEREKPKIFTESGVRQLLKVRDNAQRLLKAAGVFRVEEAITGTGGSSWTQLACIEFLAEIEEIREIQTTEKMITQHRIFTFGEGERE